MKTKSNLVSKLVILFLMFATTVFSQSITNTLGTNGLFTIKDVSNNYLTLSQSTGQVKILKTLRLENTTNSGLGIIFKGAERFLHNFGTNNIFLGINSGNFTLTTASENTGIGKLSLFSLTTGDNNTAFGIDALHFNTTGGSNTALGYRSLMYNSTGNFNTALGLNSLYANVTGDLNTALGYSSGSSIVDGNNLTLIGYDAEPSSNSADNQITLGNNAVTSLRCNVQTITSLSDARDKKNIKDLSLGLDFIMKVKPRLFNWDKREWYENNTSDGTKIQEIPTAGFIAQELDEVQTTENAEWLNLVLKDNPEKFEASYGNLLPVMVKGIQELKVESEKLKVESEKTKVESEKLKVENIQLKNLNQEIILRLFKLEQTQNKLVSELEKFKLRESKITEVKNGEEK